MASVFLAETTEVLKREPILIKINNKTLIIGDTHGDMQTLSKIVDEGEEFLQEGGNIVFLGNYTDYTCYSIEALMLVQYLKLSYPNQVFLGRGNHESTTIRNGVEKRLLLDFGRGTGFVEHSGTSSNRYSPKMYIELYEDKDKHLIDFYKNLSLCFKINNTIASHGILKDFTKEDIILFALQSIAITNKDLIVDMNFNNIKYFYLNNNNEYEKNL